MHGLLDRLDRVRESSPGRWYARCPAHADNQPSLAVTEADDGRVLIYCLAGCSAVEVIQAAGLEFSDLYPSDCREARPTPRGARWDYRGLLRMLARECHVVVAASHDLRAGRPLNDADQARLDQAAARIARTGEVAR